MKTASIIEYMSSINGYLGDICSDVYCLYLKKSDHSYDNFRTFLENWYDIESNKSISVKSYYSEDDYRECFGDIRPVIARILSNLVEMNYPPETFYHNLWDSINNDFLFGSDLEKICAVLFVLLSSKIPYFQLENALRMSDEEYWRVSQEVNKQYKKAVFALNRGYEQQTEVASQIVRFFKEIEEEPQQVVYIAKLIGYFRYEIHRLEEKIKELYSELDTET